jgi:hypothetical protein
MALPTGIPDRKKARKRAKEAKGRSGRGKFLKIPKGKSRWRVLPPWNDEALDKPDYYAVRWTHFDLPGDDKIIRCLRQGSHGTGDCPVCEVIQRYTDEGLDLGRKEAKRRPIANMIRRHRKHGNQIGLVEGPPGLGDFIDDWVGTAMDEDGKYVLHLQEGHDITITKTEKDRTNYEYAPRLSPTPALPDDELEKLKVPNLYKVVRLTDDDVALAKKCAKRLVKWCKSRLEAEEANAALDDEDEDDEKGDFRDGLEPDDDDEDEEEDEDEEGDDESDDEADEEEESEDEEDDEEGVEGEDGEEDEEDGPRGWRTDAEGNPRKPLRDSETGKAVCFGDWVKRENDPKKRKPKDTQCRICPQETACRDRATKKKKSKKRRKKS